MRLTKNGKRSGGVPLAEREPVAATLAVSWRAAGYSLRAISSRLAAGGYLNRNQQPYSAGGINSMLMHRSNPYVPGDPLPWTVPSEVKVVASPEIEAQLNRLELAEVAASGEMPCQVLQPTPAICAACPLRAFCKERLA